MDWVSHFTASVAAYSQRGCRNFYKISVGAADYVDGTRRNAYCCFWAPETRKEQIAFGVASFVLFLTLIYAVGTRGQEPELSASIQSVFVGNGQTDHDNIVAIALNVINTGTMQTIVKNWRVSIEANGQTYSAAFPLMPESFTFREIPSATPNQPTSVTLHSSDNLLEKSLSPIQVGAMSPGVLFVVFQNVDKSVFKAGVTYNVAFEDVLSRQYATQIRSTASIGTVGLLPGLKMDAI